MSTARSTAARTARARPRRRAAPVRDRQVRGRRSSGRRRTARAPVRTGRAATRPRCAGGASSARVPAPRWRPLPSASPARSGSACSSRGWSSIGAASSALATMAATVTANITIAHRPRARSVRLIGHPLLLLSLVRPAPACHRSDVPTRPGAPPGPSGTPAPGRPAGPAATVVPRPDDRVGRTGGGHDMTTYAENASRTTDRLADVRRPRRRARAGADRHRHVLGPRR